MSISLIKNNKFIALAALVLLCILSVDTFGQCAMCRAITESNTVSNERVIGTGLNPAILYLMTIPYCMLSLIAYLFFRKQIVAKFLQLRAKYFGQPSI